MWKDIFIWLACVAIGAIGGFAIGWVLFELGFVVIGSTIAIVGAGFGGLLVLYAYLKRTEAF